MAEQKEKEKFQMEYRMLGNTGLKVSTFGLGTMSFGSVEQAMELMSAVRKYGVNFFDSAELYGDPQGSADKYFGEALKKLQEKDASLWRRSELVITTKMFFGIGDGTQPNDPMVVRGANETGLSRKHIMEGFKTSLASLGLEYVDVVYAHRYDHMTPTEEIVRAFTAIIRSGKAFYWGTSMWPAQKITEAYWIAKLYNLIPPVVEQPVYNMFARGQVEKELGEFMLQQPYNLGLTVWSPLYGGKLTGKYIGGTPADGRLGNKDGVLGKYFGGVKVTDDENNKIQKMIDEVAKPLGISMVALALAWVIKNKAVSVCLLGGRKASQLEANMEALAAAKKLTPEYMQKIEDILGNKPQPRNRMMGGQMRFQKYITDPVEQ